MRAHWSSCFPSTSLYQYDSTDTMYLTADLFQNGMLGGTDK